MSRYANPGRVNLSHMFWLRSLAIIGQLITIAVVQIYFGVHLPLPAMLGVIALEAIFNALTLFRVARATPETHIELMGQLWVDLGALSALLFLSGGTTNPFVSLYLPSLAIAAAVLPWRYAIWLAAFAVACYALLGFESVPLNMNNPENLFEYYRGGMWVNFMVSVGLIAWFVSRMSAALRAGDAALGEAQQRLLRDERVVALGTQAATVAHEIGTPLSTIAMLTEEMRDDARNNPALAAYAADFGLLEQQLKLCTSALARLRSRATLSTGQQDVDVWLDQFVEQWRLRHPHVSFERIGSVPSGLLVADTVAVGQILTILLDNAARASPEHVTLESSRDADTLIFDVCDRGSGIPVGLRTTLGTMPVESTQGGHGVGLYLAFTMAARLDGWIELTDARPGPPRGTRAVLRLPALDAAHASESKLEKQND
jgi:two-component system sensor histidine kinase RegB